MADVPTGISNQNVASAPVNSTNRSTGSPWDEKLDEPEVAVNKTAVVGSLDPKVSIKKDPNDSLPLKIPVGVEEKVGQKMPASSFFDSPKPDNKLTPAPASVPAPVPAPAPAPAPVPAPIVSTPPVMPPAPDTKPLDPFAITPGVAKTEPSSPVLPEAAAPKTNTGFRGLFKRNPPPEAKKEEIKSKVEEIPEAKLGPKPKQSLVKKLFLIIPGVMLVFILASVLTEMGFLSLGIENIYGSLGAEQLWGGLSKDGEKALIRSAVEMQSHSDFKVQGVIDVSIDKSIQSDIVSPLLSLVTGESYARDGSINQAEKAIKTVDTTPSDSYYFTPTNQNSNNSNSITATNENANLNVNVNSSNSNDSNVNSNASNSNTNSTSPGTGTVINSNASEELSSGLKVVSGIFNLKTSSGKNEADLKFDDIKISTMSLKNNDTALLVKTNGGVAYGSDQTKWSSFKIKELANGSLAKNFFNFNPDNGFTVKGQRAGNEKIDSIRCYKYQIDSLEVGNSLSSLGITSDMVPSLSGVVWIGIKDKLIHKMEIKITTPVSSAVRMISLNASFSDYDVKNVITEVALSEQESGQATEALKDDDKRKQDVKSLLDALAKYKTDNKKYPISADLLKLSSSGNVLASSLVPRYLAALPDDPKGSEGWYYAYKSTDGNKCSVSARLENQSDSEGSLVNNVLLYLKYSSD